MLEIRTLINEKFAEVYQLFAQGKIDEAQTVLDELIMTLESK